MADWELENHLSEVPAHSMASQCTRLPSGSRPNGGYAQKIGEPAKSAASMDGATFRVSRRPLANSPLSALRSTNLTAGVLKNVDKFLVASGNLRYGGVACNPLCPQVDKRLPETGPAYGKTDEARYLGRGS